MSFIKNRTIQNKSKHDRLVAEHTVPIHCISGSDVSDFLKSLLEHNTTKESILFSIGCSLLAGNKNPAVKKFLSEYDFEKVEVKNIPENEFDILGSAYQYLNSKKQNLEKGSFYTGGEIAEDFVKDLNFNNGQIIFDPACGSGSFLFRSNASESQIYGLDNDPIAVMIAKFNYFIKFPSGKYPNIFCDDFFSWHSNNTERRFDYVIGNPPYGANLDLKKINSEYITSSESFSFFVEIGYKTLKEGGVFRYLLPEALLNVRKHNDVRNFILNNTNLRKIKKYSKKFSGVMSDLYMIDLTHKLTDEVHFVSNNVENIIPKKFFKSLNNCIFVNLSALDIKIIEKINLLKAYDLSTSIFGLGVVTGDNSKKLFDTISKDAEPIYTGKEVEKYNLLPAKNYIVFDREKLQQVAPDEIYRAPIKLIYKTINKNLKLAIDTTGSLTSNSANIIIPKVSDLDAYCVLALLNSNLFSFIHYKMFGGVNKIAKENLMSLPLPKIAEKDKVTLVQLTKNVIRNGDDTDLQNFVNHQIFNLTETEIKYINETCLII